MAINDISYMTSAYRMLYEIETTLKSFIHRYLFRIYGSNWEMHLHAGKTLDSMLFIDIINYYFNDSRFKKVFDCDEYELLNSLRPVRNCIAHMQIISDAEYKLLIECRSKVIRLNQINQSQL
ncbi:hypothetical protein SAMN05518684_108177 [Salipaludibacillus aurantiacus]|uniref:Swt1-like HEPN domain-containing protein n=1 Tax=Salipaludibacillus aurantiacus TaxID=1601833 RepID=A0A1H9UU10_9BACI|nr:hypothetical protein SAMN05518684_108177 [Salipaludibacillus aurantiacus]